MTGPTEEDVPLPNPSAADAAALGPVEFANLVRTASDEQLAQLLAGSRELVLGEIFRRMEQHFDPEKASGVETVVDWKITGREDGGHDCYQAVIREGRCRVQRDGAEAPRITFELPAVDFLRLASGNIHGPALFLSGGLRIEGDMSLAMTMQSFFQIPAPSAPAGSGSAGR